MYAARKTRALTSSSHAHHCSVSTGHTVNSKKPGTPPLSICSKKKTTRSVILQFFLCERNELVTTIVLCRPEGLGFLERGAVGHKGIHQRGGGEALVIVPPQADLRSLLRLLWRHAHCIYKQPTYWPMWVVYKTRCWLFACWLFTKQNLLQSKSAACKLACWLFTATELAADFDTKQN